VTVVRIREQGALGRRISFAADPQPTFAAEFCCVLSREGVRKKLCNSDQAHFTAESGHGRREEECPLCAKSRLMHCGMSLMSRIDVRPLSAM
jgi:hypothetical protein